MGVVVAIEVKCPECGARLSASGDVAKCSYCGTESRIQRRTQVLQRPKPVPDSPDLPKPVARQVVAPVTMIVLVLVGAVFPAALIGFIAMKQCGYFGGHTWATAVPLVVDVDGDGVDDLIGFDRNVSRDTMKLTAFSGQDGHVVWATPSLGTYTAAYRDGFQYAAGMIVVWDDKAHVMGFDAKTGAAKWSTTSPEVVTSSCAHEGVVVLATADKQSITLDPTTGKNAASTAGCDPNHRGMDPLGATHVEQDAAKMAISSMFDPGHGPRIAVGTRDPGTRVPMVAAFDADGKLLWKAEAPGSDPLAAQLDTPHVAISGDRVAVVYERTNDATPVLVLFDRNTGKRLFEVPTKKVFQNVLSSVRFTNRAIVVSMWNCLQAYDRTTGARMFAIGD